MSPLSADLFGQREVLIPAHVVKLNEADIAFGEAAGKQAVVGVGAAGGDVRTVHVEHMLRFVPRVGQLGHRHLHAVGHFILGDAGADFGISDPGVLMTVQDGEFVELSATGRAIDARGIGEVENGVAGG